ncbi:MAG: hypothetical protein R2847_09365 [Bacteroidia bacterium]
MVIFLSIHLTKIPAWIWVIPFSDQTTSIGVVSDSSSLVQDFMLTMALNFYKYIRNFPELKGRFTSGKNRF